MTDKEKYRQLCKSETSIPIFSRDWWLDAVAGDENWNVAIIEKNKEIIASLPYVITRKKGFTRITMPILTQKLGPWIKYPMGQKYEKKLDYEQKIFSELIDKLPQVDSFNENFDYRITNWLAFYWKGFEQTTRYTYVIDSLADLDKCYQEFGTNIRNRIKKGKKNLVCEECFDIQTFYEVNKMTFQRQNMKMPYSMPFLDNLVSTCRMHHAGKLYWTKDDENRIHAVAFMIWDEHSAYYLVAGANPKLRNSGAQILILWHMINEAKKVTSKFDFEGTMLPKVNETFRSFATKQYSYSAISQVYNKKLKLLRNIKQILGLIKG